MVFEKSEAECQSKTTGLTRHDCIHRCFHNYNLDPECFDISKTCRYVLYHESTGSCLFASTCDGAAADPPSEYTMYEVDRFKKYITDDPIKEIKARV